MDDDDDDDVIWNYKSTNKRQRRSTDNRIRKTDTASAVSAEKKSSRKSVRKLHKAKTPTKANNILSAGNIPSPTSNVEMSDQAGFCPSCQIPFCLVLSESRQSHVSQCMESDCTAKKECPSGIDCTSTTQLHYQLFHHRLLAEHRDKCSGGYGPLYTEASEKSECEASVTCTIPDIFVIDECHQTKFPCKQTPSQRLRQLSKSTGKSSSSKKKRPTSSRSKSAKKDGKSNSASKTITSFFSSQPSSKSLNISRRCLEYEAKTSNTAVVKNNDKMPPGCSCTSNSNEELRVLDCLEVDDNDRDISDMLADALCSDFESETETKSKVGQSDGANEVIDLDYDEGEELTCDSADFFQRLGEVDVVDRGSCSAHKNGLSGDGNLIESVDADFEIFNCDDQLAENTNTSNNNGANFVTHKVATNIDSPADSPEIKVKVVNHENAKEYEMFNVGNEPHEQIDNGSGSEEDIFDEENDNMPAAKKEGGHKHMIAEPNQKRTETMCNAIAQKVQRNTTPRKNIPTKKTKSASKLKQSGASDPKQSSLLSFFNLKCGSSNSRKRVSLRENEPNTSGCNRTAGDANVSSHNTLNIKKEMLLSGGIKPSASFGISTSYENHNNLKTKNKLLENDIKTNNTFEITKKTNYSSSAPLVTRSEVLRQGDKQSSGSITPVVTESESEKSYSSSGYGNRKPNRPCPFYKKMPGTPFTVDAFCYGTVPGCTAYFLTHFHYDHYRGLAKQFQHPIYCTQITANLVKMKLYVRPQYINTIPLDTPTVIDDVEITFMEANHCPGSVLILFKLKNGTNLLHTGDFRAHPSMEEYSPLLDNKIHTLYLDTTYCDPSYAFAEQGEVIELAVSLVNDVLRRNPKTLIVCGSYTIGKERVFTAVAQSMCSKIGVMREKKKVLDCLENTHLKSSLTLNLSEAQVHILPMGSLNLKKLHDHLESFPQFTGLLALEPTGWSHSNRVPSLHHIKPKASRNGVTIYGIPYSEHSSFLELKRFVQFLNSDKILPTVNNGNPQSRKKMETIFKDWMTELSSPSKRKSIPRQKTLNTFFQAFQQ